MTFRNLNFAQYEEQAERFRDEIAEEREERYEQREQRQLTDMAIRVSADPSFEVTEDEAEVEDSE